MKFERIRKINKDKLISSILIASVMYFMIFAFIFAIEFIVDYIITLNLPIETIGYIILLFGLFCITVYWIYELILFNEKLEKEELEKEDLPEIFD